MANDVLNSSQYVTKFTQKCHLGHGWVGTAWVPHDIYWLDGIGQWTINGESNVNRDEGQTTVWLI